MPLTIPRAGRATGVVVGAQTITPPRVADAASSVPWRLSPFAKLTPEFILSRTTPAPATPLPNTCNVWLDVASIERLAYLLRTVGAIGPSPVLIGAVALRIGAPRV